MATEDYDTLEDLVFSRSFRNWVLKGDTPEAPFWSNWVARHPERAETINQAKAIIHALHLNSKPLPAELVDTEVQKVMQKLREGRLNLVREIPFRPGILGRRLTPGWTIAASIAALAIIAILAGALRHYLHRQDDFYHAFLAANSGSIRQLTADTAVVTPFMLPDASTVLLTRGGRMSYPEGLLNTTRQRVVFLEGRASFEISHNASTPFYVYTRDVVTKVLGTSFTVDAGTITTITVFSGKLSVFDKPDFSAGILLTPNQQISYDPGNDRLERSLVAQPSPLTGPDTATARFDSTAVATVFSDLQSRYGVKILYEEETVAGCKVSVTLGNEPFYDKLNRICKAIGASYEAVDGNIVISATGCK